MKTYNRLSGNEKVMYMNYAASWLSLKPELITEVNSDKELIERLDSFAEYLFDNYLNDDDYLPLRPQGE